MYSPTTLDLLRNNPKIFMKRCVNISQSLNYFKEIQEEKPNDICTVNEVEYIIDRLIAYKWNGV